VRDGAEAGRAHACEHTGVLAGRMAALGAVEPERGEAMAEAQTVGEARVGGFDRQVAQETGNDRAGDAVTLAAATRVW
jgi:hypothetical protein